MRRGSNGGSLAAVTALILLIVLVILVRRAGAAGPSPSAAGKASVTGCAILRTSANLPRWMTVKGRVSRMLPDSFGRYRHQRFVITCPDKQTVLVVNDVSIGQRVPAHVGDAIKVRGEPALDASGPLIHFTHHSTSGGPGGWILDRGKLYSAPDTGSTGAT